MYKKRNRLIASCVSAALLISMTGGRPSISFAASQDSETALAGVAVSIYNYYANNDTPEADILNYLTPMVQAANEPETAAQVNANVKANKGTVSGTAAADELVGDDAEVQSSGIVSTVGYVNMRKSASLNAPIVGYLYSSCLVDIYDTVVNSEGTWYLVRSGGIDGYVFSDFVLTGEDAQIAEDNIQNKYATVEADQLEVFDTAAAGAKSIGTVHKGEIYQILEYQGAYVKLASDGMVIGYVSRDGVTITTKFAQAVAVDDWFVQERLSAILQEVDDSKRVYDEQMAARNYKKALSAIEYTIENWDTYIGITVDFGLDDLKAEAEQQRSAAVVLRDKVQALVDQEAADAGQNVVVPGSDANAAPSADPSAEAPNAQPSTTPTEPSTTPTEPSTTPTEPSTTPTEPSTTPTEPSTAPTEPSVSEKQIAGVTSCYSGGVKTAGEVLSQSEIYMHVVYSDGTEADVTEGLYCPQVGMMLAEGNNVITVYLGDHHSSFNLSVQPASTEPTPTEPTPESTESSPAPTEPSQTPTEPSQTPTEPSQTPTESSQAPTESTAAERQIAGVTSCYSGGVKTAGEVLSQSEIYMHVVYNDGTEADVTEGLYCPQVGMMLAEGDNVITVYLGDHQSSFNLSVQPAATEPAPTEPAATEPAPTEPAPTESSPAATEPAPTEPAPTEPAPTEPAPTEPAPTEPEPTQPAISEARQQVVANAYYWVGKCNYVYGQNNLTIGGQVDCSAFTMNIFATVGVGLPRTSAEQRWSGTQIDASQLRPGDLVYYSGHVAIYVGDGTIVHAKNENAGICVDSIYFSAKQPPLAYISVLP